MSYHPHQKHEEMPPFPKSRRETSGASTHLSGTDFSIGSRIQFVQGTVHAVPTVVDVVRGAVATLRRSPAGPVYDYDVSSPMVQEWISEKATVHQDTVKNFPEVMKAHASRIEGKKEDISVTLKKIITRDNIINKLRSQLHTQKTEKQRLLRVMEEKQTSIEKEEAEAYKERIQHAVSKDVVTKKLSIYENLTPDEFHTEIDLDSNAKWDAIQGNIYVKAQKAKNGGWPKNVYCPAVDFAVSRRRLPDDPSNRETLKEYKAYLMRIFCYDYQAHAEREAARCVQEEAARQATVMTPNQQMVQLAAHNLLHQMVQSGKRNLEEFLGEISAGAAARGPLLESPGVQAHAVQDPTAQVPVMAGSDLLGAVPPILETEHEDAHEDEQVAEPPTKKLRSN